MLEDVSITIIATGLEDSDKGGSVVTPVVKKTAPTPPTFGETLKSPTIGSGKKATAVPLNLGAAKVSESVEEAVPAEDTFDVKPSSNQNIKIPDFLKRG